MCALVRSKVSITRSVLMGMMKMASDDKKFPVLEVLPEQPLARDGTIFRLKDARMLCVAVVKAWSLLSLEPHREEQQLAAVLNHLEGTTHLGIMTPPNNGGGGRMWQGFKEGLEEAQVIPLDLLLIRMKRSGGDGHANLRHLLSCPEREEGRETMAVEWHMCRHWFVSHAVEYEGQGSSLQLQGFHAWGSLSSSDGTADDVVTKGAKEEREQEEEERDNNVANDQFVTAAVAASEKGGMNRRRGIMTKDERQRKRQAGPLHPLVVRAARRAIEIAVGKRDVLGI